MKAFIFSILLLVMSFNCEKSTNTYIVKLRDCNGIVIPANVYHKDKKVGQLDEIISTDTTGCITRLIIDEKFVLNSSMNFVFRKVFIGDSYLEIVIDSSKLKTNKKLSMKDTIIAN
jgi:ABC-type transporter Mla subunit MlaD